MRNKQIDILRFIGLSLIILAHVGPPDWLFRFRNFDVPMMVLIAGLSFMQNSTPETYTSYVWKRAKRLLFPVWIFLSCYFLVDWGLGLNIETLNLNVIYESYTLQKGIGYVWVIRIFLLVALAAPFILKINQSVESNVSYLILLAVIYIGYEILLLLTQSYTASGIGKTISVYLYYGIGYSLIFALGIRFQRFSTKQLLVVFGVTAGVHILLGFYYYSELGSWVSTQKYKYPPSAYYLFYSVFMSVILWKISPYLTKAIEAVKPLEKLIMFIAQNSIWIYLWHIPFVRMYVLSAKPEEGEFLYNYGLIYALAVIIVFIQVYFVRNILLSLNLNDTLKRNLKIFLTG